MTDDQIEALEDLIDAKIELFLAEHPSECDRAHMQVSDARAELKRRFEKEQ